MRQEIAISLAAGNRVIPLLIGNLDEVALPAPQEIPEEIRAMVLGQAVRLVSGGGLDLTVPGLIDTLAELVPELDERRAERGRPMPGDQDASMAARGAANLVAAMTAEWWGEARTAAREMFARVEPPRCVALVEQLDKDKSTLEAAAARARDRVGETIAARWEGRLEELLDRYPAMLQALDDAIGRLRALTALPEHAGATVNNQYVTAVRHGSAYGAQHGNVYHYASPAAPAATPPDDEPRD